MTVSVRPSDAPAFPDTPEFRSIASAFAWRRDARGVGDDAALVGARGLLCCDALAEGVHFRRDWSSLSDVGWKAVAQNVADIYAMGGIPTQAVWSVGLGHDWSARDFRDLARGALQACRHFGCDLVGGDTLRTLGPGFVSLALQGTLAGTAWVRSGAKPGDTLCLAGTLGLSAAGLALLQAGKPSRAPAALLRLHRRPQPPTALASTLRGVGKAVHAAIDLSDGLSSECHHLARSSGVRLVVHQNRLPVHPALIRAAQLMDRSTDPWILHGGEEHSLLVSLSPKIALPEGVVPIGEVTEGQGVFLRTCTGDHPLAPAGWVHR